jgi:hypothetical protein
MIYLKTVQNRVQLLVRDTGIGIAPEHLPQILHIPYIIFIGLSYTDAIITKIERKSW